MAQHLVNFFTSQQTKMVQSEVFSLSQMLPMSSSELVLYCRECPLNKELAQIDPQGDYLLLKATELNEAAFYMSFRKVAMSLIEIILDHADEYSRRQSVEFLRWDIQTAVSDACKAKYYEMRMPTNKGEQGNLWEKLHQDVSAVIVSLFGFMEKHYEITTERTRKSKERQVVMEYFRDEGKAVKKKLEVGQQDIDYPLIKMEKKMEEKKEVKEEDQLRPKGMDLLEISMIKMKKESKQHGQGDDELSKQLDQLFERLASSEDENEMKEKQENYRPQSQNLVLERQPQRSPYRMSEPMMKKKKSEEPLPLMKRISRKVSDKVHGREEYEQKSIAGLVDKPELTRFVTNLTGYHDLSPENKKLVHQLTAHSAQSLFLELHGGFTASEIALIKQAISLTFDEHVFRAEGGGRQESMRSQMQRIELENYHRDCMKWIGGIKPGQGKQNAEFVLVVYLFKILSPYTPTAKKYLSKALTVLEEDLKRKDRPYLRGAQRIAEKKTMKPTQLSKLLSQQKPLRSAGFEQSNQSIFFESQQEFESSEKVGRQFADQLVRIKTQTKQDEEIPYIRLTRLNYARRRKTVTIVISGFMSEDTEKDMEWMGLIRALGDNQLYGVEWKSSTVKDLAKFAGEAIKSTAEAALGNPLPYLLGGLPGALVKGVSAGITFGLKYRNNPFKGAKSRSEITGRYLAELLISTFPDRFVNLVAFSLGTEVLTHCLRHLIQRKHCHLVNKVVTLGGVVDQKSVQQVLERFEYPLTWYNFQSKKDYAVRFLYPITSLGGNPIGSNGLPEVEGHELTDIEAKEFVSGHMDYRCNLYGIALITGLKHD